MGFLILIAATSSALTIAALWLPGMSDWLLLSAPTLLASLLLLLRHRRRSPSKARKDKKPIVVDASNVMYWQDNTPKLETLRSVLRELVAKGYTPGAIFDANAGYLLTGKYENDRALARLLGLPIDRVVVVEKGTPADPLILRAARDLGAPILSNDRYRDWAGDHPEIETPGQLIKGGYKNGALWLGLPAT